MTANFALEKFWVDKAMYQDAEKGHYENIAKGAGGGTVLSSLANEVAKARQHIKASLENVPLATPPAAEADCKGGCPLSGTINNLQNLLQSLEKRVAALEVKCAKCPPTESAPPKAVAPPKPAAKEEDDDVDLFDSESEEESEEAKQIKEQRLAEYAARKSKKPALIAKSSLVIDVKPWDDETDMKALERDVRAIVMDGLLWGASKLVKVAFGIEKLQISCVIEDDKVSVDLLTEQIEGIEELVQSVDIAAFNKI